VKFGFNLILLVILSLITGKNCFVACPFVVWSHWFCHLAMLCMYVWMYGCVYVCIVCNACVYVCMYVRIFIYLLTFGILHYKVMLHALQLNIHNTVTYIY